MGRSLELAARLPRPRFLLLDDLESPFEGLDLLGTGIGVRTGTAIVAESVAKRLFSPSLKGTGKQGRATSDPYLFLRVVIQLV